MEPLLLDGKLDVGFTVGGGASPRIRKTTLGTSPAVVVVGKRHPLYSKRRVRAVDIEPHAWVVPRFLGLEHLPPIDQYPDDLFVGVGDTGEHVVRIENQGNADCRITSVSVSAGAGSPFSIVDPAIDLLTPSAFIDVAITFAPTAARGLENAFFYVPGTATAWLTLVGVSAELDDTSCRLQVDAQHAAGIDVSAYVGGGRTTGITIANVGGGGCLLLPFEVNGESFSAAPAVGPFDDPLAPEPETSFVAYPSTLPLDVTDGVLAPGEHVALDVAFIAPPEEGTTSARLVLRAQDAEDVTLTLTGTAFPRPPPCDCEENWGSDCTFNPEC